MSGKPLEPAELVLKLRTRRRIAVPGGVDRGFRELLLRSFQLLEADDVGRGLFKPAEQDR